MKGLEFERPINDLEKAIEELKARTINKHVDFSSEIRRLEEKLEKLRKDTYKNLSPWQKVQIARHPARPYTLDYIGAIMTDFLELHGDRFFSDDKALVAGIASVEGIKILVMGHQKGRGTQENIYRNFGCAHPEGYRKALRLMQLAERARIPVVCLIDTPGAYPGLGAEERGQAQAIATNLKEFANINTPVFCVVIGEGGSGGALGIGTGDRVAILENAYYSVISPEGCAAILWKDSTKAPDAAVALRLTAKDLLERGIVDEIIPEPMGGAHHDPQRMAAMLKESIVRNVTELKNIPQSQLLDARYAKFRRIGIFA